MSPALSAPSVVISSADKPLILISKIVSSSVKIDMSTDAIESTLNLTDGTGIKGIGPIAQYLASTKPELLGSNEIEKAQVEQWITYSTTVVAPTMQSVDEEKKLDLAKSLDQKLSNQTFAATSVQHSLADILLYCALYPFITRLSSTERYKLPNVSRFFDLMQHLARLDVYPLVDIDLNAPADEKKILEEKGDKKGAEKAVDAKKGDNSKVVAKGEKNDKTAKGQPTNKENAKPSKPAKGANAPSDNAAAASPLNGPHPPVLDMRVGHVKEVKRHPDADALYVEQIDLGTETRTVVSGLVKYMKEEDLLNKKVVLLCNLKPAKMRGIESQAMVLCTTSPDGTKVELMEPPASAAPGAKVWFEGFDKSIAPEKQLNPKKKLWEAIQPHLKTVDGGVGAFIVPESGCSNPDLKSNMVCKMVTEQGQVKSASVVGGGIK